MNNLYLHGNLGDEFLPHVKMDVSTASEAIRALSSQFPTFLPSVRDGSYNVIRGDLINGFSLSEGELELGLGDSDLHIIPIVKGEGGDSGVIKIIIGAALIAASFIMFNPIPGQAGMAMLAGTDITVKAATATWMTAAVASTGVNLALTGVAMMLAPTPRMQDPNQREAEKTSYIFNGPINVSEQGHPVPLVFGHVRTGSVVISSGIENEQLRIFPRYGVGGEKGFWGFDLPMGPTSGLSYLETEDQGFGEVYTPPDDDTFSYLDFEIIGGF